MPRFDIPDGRWLKMRLPTVNEHLAIADLPGIDQKDAKGKVERLRFFRDTFRAATLETSWGGDVGELSVTILTRLVTPWLRAAEDDAVPPASGSSSGTPPPEQRSQEPTESRRRSGGRRSSPSSP